MASPLHRSRCPPATTLLAYGAAGYAIASLCYLIETRRMGTPFADSLSDAQRDILRESKRERRRAFLHGLGVAAVLIAASGHAVRRDTVPWLPATTR